MHDYEGYGWAIVDWNGLFIGLIQEDFRTIGVAVKQVMGPFLG